MRKKQIKETKRDAGVAHGRGTELHEGVYRGIESGKLHRECIGGENEMAQERVHRKPKREKQNRQCHDGKGQHRAIIRTGAVNAKADFIEKPGLRREPG